MKYLRHISNQFAQKIQKCPLAKNKLEEKQGDCNAISERQLVEQFAVECQLKNKQRLHQDVTLLILIHSQISKLIGQIAAEPTLAKQRKS